MTDNVKSSSLELKGIRKTYGDVTVIRDLSLALPSGSLLTLLGPSGCGKSTLLRMIAGFVQPDSGDVRVGGRSVLSLPPERRPSAMVFQNYALFPHMTVAANIAFGPNIRRLPKAEVDAAVSEALALVKVAHLADRYPHELSGGQQQRVALARCLAVQPQLLLLDEPFGALDRGLREEMQVEMRKLQQRLGITMVVVTHDQEEALVLSDMIAVMNNGGIEHLGTPDEVYDRPATQFTASFMGVSNMLSGEVVKDGNDVVFRISNGMLVSLSGQAHGQGAGVLAVRPETLRLVDPRLEPGALPGEIVFVTMLGSKVKYEIDLGGLPMTVMASRDEAVLEIGSQTHVALQPGRVAVYPP
ncbi:ABC transporter ATP-binding protein [Rhizobium rhizogenes]|uniref:ABC transporter ATP-binding protein n=1 Tax=Rhizobium rhizogenes TaxID=359 RepID=UPI00157260E5|nr:ABC transporter ATP-binding protein [Rhizobium rhizogenes]NTH22897.1 ABC transporter ATP-binding protein [Rhizobium rhizogenes]NTH35926.1 ABC transporter ATP-binding protein [Rhizobium rhizogenes]